MSYFFKQICLLIRKNINSHLSVSDLQDPVMASYKRKHASSQSRVPGTTRRD